jgi:hypothetical protein
VPAAGDFQLEALGQVVPPVAGLSIRIILEVKRPFHSSNRVFLFVSTNETDSNGIVRSGPLQVSIQAGDGVDLNSMVWGTIGYCGLEYQVP